MCGRYVVAYDPETLVSGFSVLRVPVFPKRWNVAPQSDVPVIYETREGERIAEWMRWGLVPSWAKDVALGHKLNNARAEGVFDKPSFRQAVRRRRCLLPATGYYEWQASASGKQPWFISATPAVGTEAAAAVAPDGTPATGGAASTAIGNLCGTDTHAAALAAAPAANHATIGEPLAMAGLFEAWRSAPDAPWLLTCCVITCEANTLMAPIHERMPVLLARRDWATWLARSVQDAEAIAPLLAVPPTAGLQAWPVARTVSRSTSEGPELVLPLKGQGGG